jgi:glutathione S-transferase
MSEFIVTGVPGSPYVRSALLALEEKGIAWTLKPISPPDSRSPEYRQLQPFGKIPAFEYEGVRFYETQAMMRFVDRIGEGPALTPADPWHALRMDQLMNIVDDYVRGSVSGAVSFPLAVAPRFGMPVDVAAAHAAIPAAERTIAEVARLLGEQSFMAGEEVSLADLMMIAHLEFLLEFEEGRALLAPHPALSRWIARMAERPIVQATSWDALLARLGMEMPRAA